MMILGIICIGLGFYVFVVMLFLVWQCCVICYIVKFVFRVIFNLVGCIDDNEQCFFEKVDEVMCLIQIFQKFVFKQFVVYFVKYGDDLLELGCVVEDEVVILFCDICGFSGLFEQMILQQLMNFFNFYFLCMNDFIY